MDITIRPNSRISGRVVAPPSKSDAHRALICSALCGNDASVSAVGNSIDVETTIEALANLGASYTRQGDTLCYSGWDLTQSDGEVNCRESGSTLRFLLPVCSSLGLNRTFTGQGRLPERPISVIIDEMQRHGVTAKGDRLPLTLTGSLEIGEYRIPGNISSQFISGLLMALAKVGGTSRVVIPGKMESSAYVDMTVDTLAHFGARWQRNTSQEGTVYSLEQPFDTSKTPDTYEVEGDWSGAAFLLAAGALGGEIEVAGLEGKSRQGDRAIAHILEQMGAQVRSVGDRSWHIRRPTTTALQPVQVDVSEIPDLFPILAVLAAGAQGTSEFSNVARLRIKESDRVESVCSMLRGLGGNVRVEGDTVYVEGCGFLTGGQVDSWGDHRIAMSGAVASLICREPVTVLGAECCAKSYPGFFEDFAKIGGRAE